MLVYILRKKLKDFCCSLRIIWNFFAVFLNLKIFMFLFHGFSRNLYILRNPGWETDLECDTAAQALR